MFLERSACARERRAGGGTPVCLSAGMHEGRMATGTGEGGGHTALENTTATALTESSSSSSSSVPTILTENSTAANLPLTGPQQPGLHQVQQQQAQQQQQQHQQSHSRPRVSLVTDLPPANDASGNLNNSFLCSPEFFVAVERTACQTSLLSSGFALSLFHSHSLASLSLSRFRFRLSLSLSLSHFLSLSLSPSPCPAIFRPFFVSLSRQRYTLFSLSLLRSRNVSLPLALAVSFAFCLLARFHCASISLAPSTRSTSEVTGTYTRSYSSSLPQRVSTMFSFKRFHHFVISMTATASRPPPQLRARGATITENTLTRCTLYPHLCAIKLSGTSFVYR